MTPTCATCRHWDGPADPKDMNVKFGHFPAGWGTCDKIDSGAPDMPTTALAYVQDYEDYSAWLCCAPAFGCVLHEPKDAPQPAA